MFTLSGTSALVSSRMFLYSASVAVVTTALAGFIQTPADTSADRTAAPARHSEIAVQPDTTTDILGFETPSCQLPTVFKAGNLTTTVEFPPAKITNCGEIAEEPEVFELIDPTIEPVFPGGDLALLRYIRENIRWPKEAGCITGKVAVAFVIQEDGCVGDIKVLRDIGGGCGAEAVRLVRNMPVWEPAKLNGVPVSCRLTLPIKFCLDDHDAIAEKPVDKAPENKKDTVCHQFLDDRTADRAPIPATNQSEPTPNHSTRPAQIGYTLRPEPTMRLWPNPSAGPVQVEYTGEPGTAFITIMDATGKICWQGQSESPDGLHQQSVDLSGIPKGLLVVKVEQTGKVLAKQLILQ
jgi:Gram-negative bacterial TonB protein C-terminal/Secretion system C-terminal sorting domain